MARRRRRRSVLRTTDDLRREIKRLREDILPETADFLEDEAEEILADYETRQG